MHALVTTLVVLSYFVHGFSAVSAADSGMPIVRPVEVHHERDNSEPAEVAAPEPTSTTVTVTVYGEDGEPAADVTTTYDENGDVVSTDWTQPDSPLSCDEGMGCFPE